MGLELFYITLVFICIVGFFVMERSKNYSSSKVHPFDMIIIMIYLKSVIVLTVSIV